MSNSFQMRMPKKPEFISPLGPSHFMKWMPKDPARTVENYIHGLSILGREKGLAPDRFREGQIVFHPIAENKHGGKERKVEVTVEEIVKRRPSGFTLADVERESARAGAKLKQVKLEKGAYKTYALVREKEVYVNEEQLINTVFLKMPRLSVFGKVERIPTLSLSGTLVVFNKPEEVTAVKTPGENSFTFSLPAPNQIAAS